MPSTEGRVRLAELLASMSLATDLATGQSLGHGIRTCLIAVAIGEEMGCDPADLRSIFQVSLLRFLGCTADASETAERVGGDEIGFNARMATTLNGSSWQSIKGLMASVGTAAPLGRRGRLLVETLSDLGGASDGLTAHCEVAARLAGRLGLDDRVVFALEHAYERWDGKGYPAGLEGEEVPLEIRVCSVARDVDLLAGVDPDLPGSVRRRRGKAYDPSVVDSWLRIRGLHVEADWELLLAAEPEPVAYAKDITTTLTALADFVDLKSPWLRGHSREVARLAHAAGRAAGLDTQELGSLEHAALLHDVGRVGVESGIWDKPGSLSVDEWEKVRLHPYLTQRIVSRSPALARHAETASSHHERIDGTGYHRQTAGDQISKPARILAAADVLAALTSSRPHRPAYDADDAFRILRDEAAADHLHRDAVDFVVLAAGGAASPARSANPGGLTDREVEVLRHVSAGLTNRQIADKLFISPKTVGRHVENIYVKIGVSTRAAAAVFAMENALLQ
ncbi:MAG TPA: HD domain-containing phosphohydrolase [Acidimicrobiia bacterium]